MRSFEWIQTAPGSMTSAALGRWGFTLACNLYTSCSCVQFCLRTYVDAFGFSTGGHRRIAGALRPLSPPATLPSAVRAQLSRAVRSWGRLRCAQPREYQHLTAIRRSARRCDRALDPHTDTRIHSGRSRSPAMTPRVAPCDRQTYTHGSAAVRGSCTGHVGRAARDK